MVSQYQRINNVLGWIIGLLATFVYASTIEPTASFWDCGEYIATAYKLEVGHPPGAPLFLIIGRFFSLFASDPSEVAKMINLSSAICSGFTILFLFWSQVRFFKIPLQLKYMLEINSSKYLFISPFIGRNLL